MNQEIILALIALASGGGLTALIKLILDNGKQRNQMMEKNVDARIAAWQKISDKNESRIEHLERKLEIYDMDMKSLEKYVLMLEQTIVRANLQVELARPPLGTKGDLNANEH